MREILFRAKAINRVKGNFYRTKYKNGDWVYGLVSKLNKEYDIGSLPMEMTNTDGISGIEVDYNTLGQFTGLTDKNGKKIFEGDIVLFEDECAGNYEYHDCTEKRCGVIDYDCGQFFLTNRIAVEMEDLIYDNELDGEVIGNIHDNPELLEVK